MTKSFGIRLEQHGANKQGGYNLQLDSLPIDGKILMLPAKEYKE